MITVKGDNGPASEWRIEVSGDEPPEVHSAAGIITAEVQRGARGKPRTATLLAGLRNARNEAKRNNGEPSDPMRKAMHALARELELTRADRLDLAEMVLERDIESWGELSWDDAIKLLTAMNGYIYIRHLRTRT